MKAGRGFIASGWAGFIPKRPHLIHAVILVEDLPDRQGKPQEALYRHTVDRSKYPPEKLRAIRAAGKHR